MSEEDAFLRAMVAQPEDALPRLVYADWLEERNDPRGGVLRLNWDLPRVSFLDWQSAGGNLEAYLTSRPEAAAQVNEVHANRRFREQLTALPHPPADEWLTLIDTLARPFIPFFFWNNTGAPSFAPGELPFREPIGTRGTVVTFESAFRGENAWQPGLLEDLAFLRGLSLEECYYGAASCPTHPFVCELAVGGRPLVGADVLAALKARDFRSQHIRTLDAAEIPAPGYQPGTDNDEIHTDPAEQGIFPRPTEGADPDYDPANVAERNATHTALRARVTDGRLWYVLLHSRTVPKDMEWRDRHWCVVLFAVGRSLRGNRLIGVVSHQLCHNFCD